jgi:hypothetical protein
MIFIRLPKPLRFLTCMSTNKYKLLCTIIVQFVHTVPIYWYPPVTDDQNCTALLPSVRHGSLVGRQLYTVLWTRKGMLRSQMSLQVGILVIWVTFCASLCSSCALTTNSTSSLLWCTLSYVTSIYSFKYIIRLQWFSVQPVPEMRQATNCDWARLVFRKMN